MQTEFSLKGFYRIKVRRPDGRVRVDTGWFPNLVTDAGLNEVGAASGQQPNRAYCILVGSGNATPAVGDVALSAFVAASETVQGATEYGWGKDADLADRYYVWNRQTRRFAEGAAQGILAEIGANTANPPGDNPEAIPLFSRALIVDGGGNPTTITVLADEILDVTYEARVYMPVIGTEGSGTFDLSGVSYDWQHVPIGYAQQPNSPAVATTQADWGISSGFHVLYPNDPVALGIGPEDSLSPLGGGGNSSGGGNSGSYVINSYSRLGFGFWDLNQGNIGGARCVAHLNGLLQRAVYFRVGRTSDDAPIPKTASDELTLFPRITWARL